MVILPCDNICPLHNRLLRVIQFQRVEIIAFKWLYIAGGISKPPENIKYIFG